MNYIEALQRLVDGKKIKKKDWADQEYYFIADNKIYNSLGMECFLSINDEEELTEDTWEIYMDERDKLITDGKRWRLIQACTDGGGCEKCERTRKELYKFCKLSMRPFYGALLEITDNKVNELYEKVKGELDA